MKTLPPWAELNFDCFIGLVSYLSIAPPQDEVTLAHVGEALPVDGSGHRSSLIFIRCGAGQCASAQGRASHRVVGDMALYEMTELFGAGTKELG